MKPVEIEFLMKDGVSGPMSKIEGSATSMAGRVVSESSRVESALKKVGFAVGAYFTLDYAKSFAQSMVKVRGEIESLDISFRTLLGSQAASNNMMRDIKDIAVKSPLTVSDLGSAAKILLGFNVEAEKVIPTLRALSDVTMGNPERFKSMALAFAQCQSAGKLMGQDLLQMINAGFNPLSVISQQTGKNMADLRKEMEDGAISSQMVADAFVTATSAGGKFFGLTEELGKGINGNLNKLQGAVVDMFNGIGTQSQGFITDAIEGATTVVQHYEEIGRVLTVLIATYGAYRAALLTTVAIQKASALADNIKLVMMFRKELGLLTAAQQAFNIKALANPYILLATAIIGACAAIWQIVSAKQAEAEAIEEAIKPMREEFTQTNLLIGKLKDSTLAEKERKAILEELKQVNPDIVKGIDDESTAYEELSKRLEAYNKSKLAEIAIKKFSLNDDFDDAVTELSKARGALQSESAGIIDVYSTLFARFKEMETSGKEIPADLKTLFNSIIDSSVPETQKVESLFAAYDAVMSKVKAAHGAYTGADKYVVQSLFAGLNISDYKDAMEEVSDATDEYEQKAKSLKGKIDNIAKSIYTDEKERQEFIMSQWAIYFPDEVKNVETAIDGAAEKTRTWKDDIEDVVGEDYSANINAATNINDVVEFIQKQIKSEKEKVDNMKPLLIKAGFDFSTMSFPAPLLPSEYNTQLQAEYTKSANALTGLQTAQKKLNIPNGAKSTGDAVTDKIKTHIELVKSAREEYNQLLKVMSSDAAYAAIQSSASYSKVKLKDIVLSDKEGDGYVNYLNGIVSELSKRKTKEAKDLVAKLQKEIDTINLDKAYDAEVRRYDSTKQSNEYTQSVSAQVRQSQLDIRQSEIDAMDEGFNKELAVIGLNYDKLILENQKRQDEWVKSLTENEKGKWLINNPDKEESQFTQTVDISNLTDEQQKALKEYTEIAEAYRLQSEEKVTAALIEKYQSYTERRAETEKKYNEDIAALKLKNKDGENNDNIAEAERQKNEALAAIDGEVARRETDFNAWADRVLSMGLKSLQKALATAQATLKNSDSKLSETELAALRAKIAALEKQIKIETDKDTQLSPAEKSNKKWGDTLKVMNEVSDTVDNVTQSFDGLDDSTKAALSAAMNISGGIISMITGIQALAITGAEAIKGVEKASVILAIIGTAIQILSTILSFGAEAEKRHQEALEQIARSKIALQREYNLLLLEQNLLMKEATTVFGEESIAKAIRAVEVYKDAIGQFNAELKGDKPSMNWFENMTGDMLGSYQERLKAYNDGIGALNQISVKTGHEKTGLFGWGKGSGYLYFRSRPS